MPYDELCLFMKERYEYNIIQGAYIGYINDKQFFIQLSECDKEYYKITYTRGWFSAAFTVYVVSIWERNWQGL